MELSEYSAGVGIQHEPETGHIATELAGNRIVVFDSVTHVARHVAAEGIRPLTEIIVNASYTGVYAAQFVRNAQPKGWIGIDCGIGKDGAGIAGLWYFEALGIPAASANIDTVEVGNGLDLFENGIISRVNQAATSVGVGEGMTVAAAAQLMLEAPVDFDLVNPTGRRVIHTNASGCSIVAVNSIINALPEDRDTNVLCCAGHAGRSVSEYVVNASPKAFIFSDGGMGKNRAGIACLADADSIGIPGAAVAVQSALLGNGESTYRDGVISAVNNCAADLGVTVGMTARAASLLLLQAEPAHRDSLRNDKS